MDNRPTETTLFRRIAKDYKPKEAAMQICRHIEGLEARIAALEAVQNPATADLKSPSGSAKKPATPSTTEKEVKSGE